MEIGVDGVLVMGWWRLVLMEWCDGASGLTEIGGLERCCRACDGCGVDGVLALVLLGFECERKNKKEEEEKKEEERKGSIEKKKNG